MWDVYVFDRFEAAAGSKKCARIFVPALEPSIVQRSIPMMFCIHIQNVHVPWVVLECSANFGLVAQDSDLPTLLHINFDLLILPHKFQLLNIIFWALVESK